MISANAQAKEESGILRSSIDSVNSNLAESVSTLSEQEQKLDNLQQTVDIKTLYKVQYRRYWYSCCLHVMSKLSSYDDKF